MDDNIQMRSWAQVNKGPGGQRAAILGNSQDRDALELARVGKKQVLERRFGLVSMIGFACSLMVTWEGTLVNFIFGLENGGPAGLIYGYVISWIGTTSVFICLAELASMLPSAGGQYHWTSILAPEGSRKIFSYVTGWVTTIAWIAAPATTALFCGSLVQSVIVLNKDTYHPTAWQLMLLMDATLIASMAVNTWFGIVLPAIEVLFLIIHVVGFFAVLIPIVSIGPLGDVNYIFTKFINEGGWPTQGLSFCVGIRGFAAAFLGADGAIHMAEEVDRSTVNVPRSLITSVILNGALGFVILVVFLLCAGDLTAVLESGSDYPFINILSNRLGSVGAATALTTMIMVLNFCSAIGLMSGASRMVWAFSRDQAVPGWKLLRRVDSRTSIPVYCTYLLVIIGILLAFINLGSNTALNDVLSLVLEGLYGSYLIAIALLLYRRMRNEIADPPEDLGMSIAGEIARGTKYTWGPFYLKGWVGKANNIVGVCWSIFIIFFGFWPASNPVTAENMNYSIVVVGGVMLISMTYYFGWARKSYQGPIVEVEVSET